jgi:hypothetical protein
MLAIGGTPGEGLVVAGVIRGVTARGRFHGGPQPERDATGTNGQLGPQWSLGLQAVFSATSSATMKNSDNDDTGYKFSALSAGLEYTFTLH